MNSIVKYLQNTIVELKQVNWPTQNQAFLYTALVIVISLVVAAFTGAFDTLFSKVIERLVNLYQ